MVTVAHSKSTGRPMLASASQTLPHPCPLPLGEGEPQSGFESCVSRSLQDAPWKSAEARLLSPSPSGRGIKGEGEGHGVRPTRDSEPGQFTRRTFLGLALAVAGSELVGPMALEAANADAKPKSAKESRLIDTNITLGRWPFRRLPLDETPALVAKLRQQDVTQAWVGSFEALFCRDMTAANARLAEECHRHGRRVLLPFGSVNVTLPDWEEDFRRCVELHGMRGLRLYPNYHGYQLDDPAFAKLLSLATERGLVVQIATDMEDERTQSRIGQVPHVDARPLLALLKNLPGACVMLLNWFRAVPTDLVKQLAATGACFDIATVEGVGGVAKLIEQISVERVVFGSHAPVFYFESAALKLKESALNAEEMRAVCVANARRCLA